MGRVTSFILFFILSAFLVIAPCPPDCNQDVNWGNNDWVGQQDLNSYTMGDLVAGVEQNPNLLDNPAFLTAFETKLTTDPSSLDNKPEVLKELGNRIGMDFSSGSGISAYSRGPNGLSVSTKGCNSCDPSYKISVMPEELKAQGTKIVVNSDGSIEFNTKEKHSFLAKGGIVSASGDLIKIETGTITDGGRDITTLPGSVITTKGDGIYTLKNIFLNDVDDEKMWLGSDEDFQLDLRDPEKLKLSQLGTKEIMVHKMSDHTKAFILKSGSVVLESSSKFFFDKNSQFTIVRDKSRSTFDADNNLRFCFGECYGSNGFLPQNYEDSGVSTVELLEDYEVAGQYRSRNILKFASVNGDDINADLFHSSYSFVYVSVYSSSEGIGHVNLQQRGTYGDGTPYFSLTKMDNTGTGVTYGKNRDTGEAYILGGSPVLVNRPPVDGKKNVKQDVQLVFLSNEAYASEKPVYGSGKIDLLTLFLEDRDLNDVDFLNTGFVGVGRLTNVNPRPEARLDSGAEFDAYEAEIYEQQMRAIDRAKELRAQGKLEEANELITNTIEFPKDENGDDLWQGDRSESQRERRRNVLEYASASGFTDEVYVERDRYIQEVKDGQYNFNDDEVNIGRSEKDIEDLNRFMPYQSEYSVDDTIINSMSGMQIAMKNGMTQGEYYDRYIVPLTFLNEDQKALFDPNNREAAYVNYDALLYQHYCTANPAICDQKNNMYEYQLNNFAEQWE